MSSTTPGPRWPSYLFRTVSAAQAALVLVQAVLAGQLLSGHAVALDLHEGNASVVATVALVQLVCAVLLWRPGRGPIWPIAAVAGLFGALTVQIGAGYAGQLGLHVPLGVVIFGLTVLLLVGPWRLRPEAAGGR